MGETRILVETTGQYRGGMSAGETPSRTSPTSALDKLFPRMCGQRGSCDVGMSSSTDVVAGSFSHT